MFLLLFLLFGGSFFYYIPFETKSDEVINPTDIYHPEFEEPKEHLLTEEEKEKHLRVKADDVYSYMKQR